MFYNLISKKDHFNKLINIGSGAEKYLLETPYGYSKNIINKLVHKYDNFYTLRIYGVFSEDELDTRFIKSNIKRYLNNEPIIIHQNKQMDFFYMKDLVLLIDYYILNSNPPKEIDCTYPESKTLCDIADIINQLDKHKVNIKLEKNDLDRNYIGNFTDVSLPYKGIVTGIIETYNKLK
jgi:nucleoside-diphosphate-sugar epimerase